MTTPRRGLLSLFDTAVRVVAGEDVMHAVREFLDQVDHCSPEQLAELIAERPAETGDARADAMLAGVAEHLASTRQLRCPSWVREPGRFLDRFWFVSAEPGFRAIAIAQSPMALKRRGIFWPARSLERV